MKPTIGRIVHYTISENDAQRIKGWRPGNGDGNVSVAGDVVPLIIVRIWPNEYGADVPGVNGQAFLDGNDSLWVMSAKEGTGQGEWFWPPIQKPEFATFQKAQS